MGMLNRSLLSASASAVSGLACLSAGAQLSTERTYYGLDRPFPIVVESPEAEHSLSLKLLEPGNTVLEIKESIDPGTVDLAALFPSLWELEGEQGVLYAQLYSGETPIGAAIVLQPMITPDYAALDRNGQVAWPQSQRVFSGYRAYVEKHVVMTTSEGDITFRMRPDAAPNSVWNFMTLGAGGFYTDIAFHRIIASPNKFVIQAGDPRGEGGGGPGYFVDLERSNLPHDFGVISMARSTDPNSNGSQIFICLSREGTKGLDGRYTGFGEAVAGADSIMKIAGTPLTSEAKSSTPVDPPLIKSVHLIDASPRGTGGEPVKEPQSQATDGR